MSIMKSMTDDDWCRPVSYTHLIRLPLVDDPTVLGEKVIQRYYSNDQESRLGNRAIGQCNSKSTSSLNRGYFLPVGLTI